MRPNKLFCVVLFNFLNASEFAKFAILSSFSAFLGSSMQANRISNYMSPRYTLIIGTFAYEIESKSWKSG